MCDLCFYEFELLYKIQLYGVVYIFKCFIYVTLNKVVSLILILSKFLEYTFNTHNILQHNSIQDVSTVESKTEYYVSAIFLRLSVESKYKINFVFNFARLE